MKILHVIDNLGQGGAQVLLKDLVFGCHIEGIKVEVALLQSLGTPLEKELLQLGIPVWTTNARSVYSPINIVKLASLFQHYDLVHVHLFPAQLWVAQAAKLVRKTTPIITTEHNTHNRRRKKWFRPLDSWMYRQFSHILCISEATAESMIRWLPQYKENIRVVPNGINLKKFREAIAITKKEAIGIEDVPVVVSTARLEPQKDHFTLIKAIVEVPTVHLVLIGDGVLRERLQAFADELGVLHRVHFLGKREDVPQLLKMADLYVQSSNWEGFGIAAVEAMASGLPVIVSRVPGLMDVVGDVGVVFNKGDAKELSQHIKELIMNQVRRSQLGETGKLHAEKYNIDLCVEQHIRIYQEIEMNRSHTFSKKT